MIKFYIVFLLLTVVLSAVAEERIHSFESTIEIQKNGTLRITESIHINTELDKIRRGIYRDFPTNYKDKNGQLYIVGFDVISVKRNRVEEKYTLKRHENGMRLRIGQADKLLKKGQHTYELVYETTRQIGFFPSYDELYWSVTGTGWEFPIDKASSVISFHNKSKPETISLEGYTGAQGSKAKRVMVDLSDLENIKVETTQPLKRYQGLTFVMTFSKGIVQPPSIYQKIIWYLKDNSDIAGGILSLNFLLLWFWVVWNFYGRDPTKGIIMPHYQPPDDLPPSVLNYLSYMRYSVKAFTADLLYLSSKDFIRIIQTENHIVERKTRMPAKGAPGALLGALIPYVNTPVKIEQVNHAEISRARILHEESVKTFTKNVYFRKNRGIYLMGLILSTLILSIGLMYKISDVPLVLSLMSTGLIGILIGAGVNFFQAALNPFCIKPIKKIAFGIILLMIAGCGAYFVIKDAVMSPVFLILLAVICTLLALFLHWMPAYTSRGRALMDKIEGYRLYLSVAEKDDLQNVAGPKTEEPKMDGQLYTAFLPYAVALGVEEAWTRRLSAVLGEAQAEEAIRLSMSGRYEAHKYNDFNPTKFSAAVGAGVSSAIASASIAPGTSSGVSSFGGGSSGGGFSGGGGGGGGGGGW